MNPADGSVGASANVPGRRWWPFGRIFAAQGAAAATAPAPSVATAFKSALATLLASHILRDGELVILILRPSLWFVLLSSLRFIGVTLLAMIAAKVFDPHLPGPNRDYVELGIIVIAGRLMWASLQWMGRLYVLTDMRLLSLAGVLHVEVFDCPLRKVARTRLLRNVLDRLVGVGSIEIAPQDESLAFGVWLTIARPKEIHEQVLATLRRAKQGLSESGEAFSIVVKRVRPPCPVRREREPEQTVWLDARTG